VMLDGLDPEGRGQMGLAGTGAADQLALSAASMKSPWCKAHQSLLHLAVSEVEAGEITIGGEAGYLERIPV
jgi:hypothetical protein